MNPLPGGEDEIREFRMAARRPPRVPDEPSSVLRVVEKVERQAAGR